MIAKHASLRKIAQAVRFWVVLAVAAGVLVGSRYPAAAAVTTTRLSGVDRIVTAIEVSRHAFPDGAPVVVLADANGFADALAAAPMAGAEGAPLLLNTSTTLHREVATELERLDPALVLVMGGTKAQSTTVISAVEAQGRQVIRLSGPDRFATAAAAAQRAVDRWLQAGDGEAGDEVIVALGRHPLGDNRAWPDALAAGVLAGLSHRPVLLVDRDQVPGATRDALRELGATRAIVVGGTAAITDATAQSLGVPFTRISGPSRYATGAALVDAAAAAGADVTDLTIVTGGGYADALGAVPSVLARGGVLLLVDGADLDGSPEARKWIEQHRDVTSLTIVGGSRAITAGTVTQVQSAIDGTGSLQLALEPVVAAQTALAIRGDHLGRLVFAERAGRVRVVVDGQPATLLDITAKVSTDGERGLLDLQLHPDYASNRRFFVHYSDTNGDTVLSEFKADQAGTGTVGGESILYTTAQPASNHNGGGLDFLPDGTLVLALGDGGGSNDRYGNGQNLSTPLGSLLRFDVSTPGTARVPADNPYVGRAGNDWIWASGLRNPFRITVDDLTGILYVADVGQGDWEEVNAVAWSTPGLDYGWSTVEGPDCFPIGTTGCNRAGLTDPVTYYDHANGRCSITGGVVHRGAIGQLRGHYFYGDFCSGQVFSFRLADGEVTEQHEWTDDLAGDQVFRGSLFAFGSINGETYVANGSQIHRIVAR